MDIIQLIHNGYLILLAVRLLDLGRKKSLYKDLRQYMGDMLKDLASQKECKILEGPLMADHVHILISIPPNIQYHRLLDLLKAKVRYR